MFNICYVHTSLHNRSRSLITPARLKCRGLQLFTLVNTKSCGSVRKREANGFLITPGVITWRFQSMDVVQFCYNHTSDYTIGRLSSLLLLTHGASPPMATNGLLLVTNHHQWRIWPTRTVTYLESNGT